MKKIFQLIFSKNPRSAQKPVKVENIRRMIESPDSMPGERLDLHKRQSGSAPVDIETATGRVEKGLF